MVAWTPWQATALEVHRARRLGFWSFGRGFRDKEYGRYASGQVSMQCKDDSVPSIWRYFRCRLGGTIATADAVSMPCRRFKQ